MIALLLGLQLGYTKFSCFLSEWDSRDRQNHIKKDWPKRESLTPGQKIVVSQPLVASEKIYLLPLHIKLCLMKHFIKTMDHNGEGFNFLTRKIPRISDAKIKEGIFVGPQLGELMNDKVFEGSLNETKAAAWNSFKDVVI